MLNTVLSQLFQHVTFGVNSLLLFGILGEQYLILNELARLRRNIERNTNISNELIGFLEGKLNGFVRK